jgi:lysophospholipase L1-like esterase
MGVALALGACGGTVSDPPFKNTVVMMGDSITCYWNDPGWMDDASDLIAAHLPHVVDQGAGGLTTRDMAERFKGDVLAYHPQTIVIEGGTNDVIKLQSTDTQYLFQMIDEAVASGADLIVGVLPPDDSDPSDPERQSQLAAWRQAIIDGAPAYGYKVADYYTPMLKDGKQNTALFYSDGVHPVAAGYAVMWDVLRPLLNPSVFTGDTAVRLTNNHIC